MMLTLLRDSFSSCVALFFARFDFSKISTEPVPFVFSFRVLVFGAKSFLFAESEKKNPSSLKKQSMMMMMQQAQQQYHQQRFAHACARNERRNTVRCVLLWDFKSFFIL